MVWKLWQNLNFALTITLRTFKWEINHTILRGHRMFIIWDSKSQKTLRLISSSTVAIDTLAILAAQRSQVCEGDQIVNTSEAGIGGI